MLAIFTGFDSAWYPGKTGAICDLVLEVDSLRLAAPPIPANWDCALARVRQRAEINLRVWAIDQPLVVSNEQGCRPVDIDLMRALMRDFQVGAHTANLHRPPWQPGAPIWQFLQVLEEAGYRHDPMAVPHATSGRFYFECYARIVKEFIGHLAHECFGQTASINDPMADEVFHDTRNTSVAAVGPAAGHFGPGGC
jgi:predicted RNase H-like nuclease